MTCNVAISFRTNDIDGNSKEISLYCQDDPDHEGRHWTSYSVGLLAQYVSWEGDDIEITN